MAGLFVVILVVFKESIRSSKVHPLVVNGRYWVPAARCCQVAVLRGVGVIVFEHRARASRVRGRERAGRAMHAIQIRGLGGVNHH